MPYFLTLFYVVFSYLRPGEQFLDLAPYRIMLWLGLAAGLAAGCKYLLRGRWGFKSRDVLLVTTFTVMIVVSRIATGWLGGAWLAFEDFGLTAAVFFCIVITVDSIRRLRILAVSIVLALLVIVAQSFAAYHYGYQAEVFVLNQGVDSQNDAPVDDQDQSKPQGLLRIRALGFLNDPNDLGQALVMALPFVALAWRRGRRLRNLVLVHVPVAIFLIAVYLTHSRGAVFSLLVLVLVAARKRLGNTKAALAGALLVMVALAANVSGGRAVSSSDASGEGRLDAWSAGLQMLRGNPVFGVGYNFFTENHELTAHNSFVLCFAELGLAGYLVWLAMLGVSHAELASLEDGESPEELDVRRWARAMHLSLYSFLAAAFFLSRTYSLGLYILLGMSAALVEIAHARDQPVVAPRFSWVLRRAAVFEVASIALIYALMRVRHV
ncbi:MAG TPA: O-antigen ligase family protein [Candidatus Acidoferrales bacterium]|jgi:putative inorganic carbon (HCO3(-)) transporter|nr:O-antigen ligase family protein [Candidatus Acidoferrales bacterium]